MTLSVRLTMAALVAVSLVACKEERPPVAAGTEIHVAAPLTIAPAPRFATVDVQRVFKDCHVTREAQKEINIERAKLQEENNDRLARIRGIETDLENLVRQLDDPALPESRRQAFSNDLKTKRQEGIALDRERREFLERRNQALKLTMERHMQVILEEIRRRVEEKAQAGDYDYVFDKSAETSSQTPFFLGTPDENDLTDSLLEELNAADGGSGEADAGGTGPDPISKPD